MPRETIIGNGRLAIAFDKESRIRDLYYPQIGLENHVGGHIFRNGVWVDGKFRWVDGSWDIKMEYMPETLVSRTRASYLELGITIETNEGIHNYLDVYLKKLIIHNNEDSQRKARLFFSHDFHIYGDAFGDTVLYDSALNSIIHYKRKRYFLINGVTSQGKGIYQFATGTKEIPGMAGTWVDAEDGLLGGFPISQGSVDSTVSFELDLAPKSYELLYYWIACGQDLSDVQNLDSRIKKTGVEQLLLETENYFAAWVDKKRSNLSILPNEITKMFKESLLIMRAGMDNGGGIIASCDSDNLQFNRDTYAYIWMRDGALIANAWDRAGFQDVSRLFFQFCNKTITTKGYFHHKYAPDGSIGSSWLASIGQKGRIQLPIQEDETAIVLYALWKHFESHNDIEFIAKVYDKLVVKTSEFLLDYVDPKTGLPRPSFDLWEEKVGTFTWTVSAVYAALIAAANFAKVFFDRDRHEVLSSAAEGIRKAMITYLYNGNMHRFAKAINEDGSQDMTIDSSLSGVFLFEVFDASDEVVESTMRAVADKLWVKTNIGGVARYENDGYFRVSKNVAGNPWFICTLWLARWHIARASSLDQLKEGLDLLFWATKHAQPSGVMGEQIDSNTGAPLSVSPLFWSHAEFVTAVCEYLNRYNEISSFVASQGRDADVPKTV
jgi:GH15 family glucan-1,4-alpha-glucosidase